MKFTAMKLLTPEFIPAVNSLLKKDMEMPKCVAFAEAISELEKHVNTCNTIRQSIVDKYIKKDANGQPLFVDESKNIPVFVSPEASGLFQKETQELLEQEFDIGFDEKIQVTKEDKMSPQFYMLIKDLIEYTG